MIPYRSRRWIRSLSLLATVALASLCPDRAQAESIDIPSYESVDVSPRTLCPSLADVGIPDPYSGKMRCTRALTQSPEERLLKKPTVADETRAPKSSPAISR